MNWFDKLRIKLARAISPGGSDIEERLGEIIGRQIDRDAFTGARSGCFCIVWTDGSYDVAESEKVHRAMVEVADKYNAEVAALFETEAHPS